MTIVASIPAVNTTGLQDFFENNGTIVYGPSEGHQLPVLIGLVDDTINEPEEGFLVVLTVDEGASDPRDVANLRVLRNVTLAVIVDDDRKLILHPVAGCCYWKKFKYQRTMSNGLMFIRQQSS